MQRLVFISAAIGLAATLAGTPAPAQDYSPSASPYSPAAAPGGPVVYQSLPSGPLMAQSPGGPGWPPAANTVSLPSATVVVPSGPPAVAMPSNYPLPQPAVSAVVPAAAPTPAERLLQSTWYGRVDYFHWNEKIGHDDFVNESGPLWTLGYVRRIGPERFRGELFGGIMNYDGSGQFEDGLEHMTSTTRYLGLRGEYDLLFEPSWLPERRFVLGIGTRFWVRDLPDGLSDQGDYVYGYQETWWTIYPYIGFEAERQLGNGLAWFGSIRAGATPLTYEHASFLDVAFYPRCGLLAQAELGMHGTHFSLGAYFEMMTWTHSAIAGDYFQPNSQMLTVGGKGGWSF